jgi:hypothetical protein
MSGLGTGPIGLGPLGIPDPTLAPDDKPILTSSRKIDAQSRRYVTTSDGGFEAMDDVAQRAFMLLQPVLNNQGGLITGRTEQQVKADVRDALKPLTGGKMPAAKLVGVTAQARQPGMFTAEVFIQSLITNTITKVQL